MFSTSPDNRCPSKEALPEQKNFDRPYLKTCESEGLGYVGVSIYTNSIILNSFAMRSNYHNPSQSEDSVTKISRSKSRNQVTIANKIKEKVVMRSRRKSDGTNASTSSRSPSTTTRTSRTSSVTLPTRRPQEQVAHSQQKVTSAPSRNDRNDLSKAKRVHEASLDKSTPQFTKIKWETSRTCVATSSARRKR